jgi:TatD DNase family protein
MNTAVILVLFINIHTHRQIYDAKIELVNHNPESIEKSNFYSYGLHPWHLQKEDLPWQLDNLRRVSGEKKCLAIGECGLDKVCAVDFDLQTEVFEEQIRLANTIQKPLIIHCVKAFNELINCLNMNDNKVPVIIHGFNNNENIAKTLSDHGYSFSFGKALLSYDSNASKVIRKTGRKHLFLETDDSDVSIKYVYKKASELLGIDEEILKEQIKANFENLFQVRL